MADLSDDDVDRIAEALAAKLSQGPVGPRTPGDGRVLAQTIIQELSTKTMAFLGVDMADKEQVAALKADLSFVRSLRERCDRVGRSMTDAITKAIMLAILGLLVVGFAFWIRSMGSSQAPPPMTISG